MPMPVLEPTIYTIQDIYEVYAILKRQTGGKAVS